MTKYIPVLLLLIPDIVTAQAPEDALRYSFYPQGGTARNMAIGGAMGSLGGDINATFVNPAGLQAIGKNLFKETIASGQEIQGTPGMDGMGGLMQGFVEMSNVKLVEEMVNMIVAQRAYESNSKSIITSDSMLGTAIGMKR